MPSVISYDIGGTEHKEQCDLSFGEPGRCHLKGGGCLVTQGSICLWKLSIKFIRCDGLPGILKWISVVIYWGDDQKESGTLLCSVRIIIPLRDALLSYYPFDGRKWITLFLHFRDKVSQSEEISANSFMYHRQELAPKPSLQGRLCSLSRGPK